MIVNVTYLIILLVYMAAVLFLGWLAMKASATLDDFFVAGRNQGVFVVAGTFGATLLSAGSFIGTTGLNYAAGWSALWQLLGTLTAGGIIGLLLAHKLWRFGHKFEAVSVPDLFSIRYYGKLPRAIAALSILILYVAGLGVQNMGFTAVLSSIVKISPNAAMTIAAVVFVAYTIAGGMKAVAWTDAFQFMVMIVGVLIAFPFVLRALGGYSGINLALAHVPPPPLGASYEWGKTLVSGVGKNLMPLGLIFGWTFVWALGNPSQPHIISRMYMAKSARVARQGVAWALMFFTVYYVISMTIGAAARATFPNLLKMDLAFPTMVTAVLDPISSGIVLAALIAAIMSTTDTMLMTAGIAVSHDIYRSFINPKATERQIFILTRIIVAVVGFGGLGVAIYAANIPGLLFLWGAAFSIFSASFFPSLIAAFYWPRATREGNVCSMITGIVLVLLYFQFKTRMPLGYLHPIIPGTVASTLVLVVVSLLTPKPPQELIDKFYGPDMVKP